MANDSPAAILFRSDGYELTVHHGQPLPVDAPTIVMGGSDGTNARYITVDNSGHQVVVGTGTPGVSSGGLITIQGDPAGTPVPVSGTITATNPSVGANNSAIPSSSTQIGGSDGYNLQVVKVFDLDTDAGSDYNLGISIRLPGAGGSVPGGTSVNPLRIDPTGTTVQPVSGTITITQSTPSNLLANVGGLGASGVAITGNPVRIGVSDGVNTRDVLSDSSGRLIMIGAAADGYAATSNPILIAGSDGVNTRTLKTDASGTLSVNATPAKSTTGVTSSVASSIASVTLLSANPNRLGATFYNDSASILYLKLGATASASSYTVQLFYKGYYEIPSNYIGQVDGIWTVATGSARVTELT